MSLAVRSEVFDIDSALVDLIEANKDSYGSNFESCEINLWEDYLYFLAKNKVFSSELTLAAAEYVMGGAGVQDLWGIHERLKALFTERAQKRKTLMKALTLDPEQIKKILHKLREHAKLVSEQTGKREQVEQRGEELDSYITKEFNDNTMTSGDLESFKRAIETWGHRKVQLECLCLYRTGLQRLHENKKNRYKNLCPKFFAEDKASIDAGAGDFAGSDASGLKYKRILTYWAFINATLHDTMFVSEENVLNKMREFIDWYEKLDWYAVETKRLGSTRSGGKAKFDAHLYKFTEHKHEIRPAPSCENSDWQDVGIISDTTNVLDISEMKRIFNINDNGLNGLHASVIAGMFGIFKSPMIPRKDDDIGEWRTCHQPDPCERIRCRDIKRYIQDIPYNTQCNNPTPAAACIKKWVIVTSETNNSIKEDRFLIDPWIPIGVNEIQIIKDSENYSSMDENNRIWKAYDNLVKEFYTFSNTTFILKPRNRAAMSGWDSDPPHECGGKKPCVSAEGHKREAVNEESIRWWIPKLHPLPPDGPAYMIPNEQQVLEANRFKEEQLIKSKAGEYILHDDVKLLKRAFSQFLTSYGEYVYRFHYVFPRLANRQALEYPPLGFHSYLTSLKDVLNQSAEKQLALGSGSSSGEKGHWGKLLDQYVKDLTKTNMAYQRFQSIPLGTDKEQPPRSKNLHFSSMEVFDTGRVFSSRKNADGSLIYTDQEQLNVKSLGRTSANFAIAEKQFQKNKAQREKERQHWEKTVGQTQRGKNLKKAAQSFYNILSNPLSQGIEGEAVAMVDNKSVTNNRPIDSISKDKMNTDTTDFLASKDAMEEDYCQDGFQCINGVCNNGKNCIKRMTMDEEAKHLGISLEELEILSKTSVAVNNKIHWKKVTNSLGRKKILFNTISLAYLRIYHKLVILRPSH